jgi:hypothetical protein
LHIRAAMDPADVTVATMTWARSAAEADLVERGLSALHRLGLHVTVADRGTDAAFLARLNTRSGLDVTVTTRPGLVAQIQDSFALAARHDTRFLLYTEPDKLPFFETGLPAFVREAPADEDVGIVIAARSPRSFDTFPPMQRYTETVVNDLCARMIGAATDYCYGPFLMHRSLVAHIAALPQQLGWGWRPSTFLAARRQGLRVVARMDDYPCPPDQRDEDDRERAHRLQQLSDNVLGLIER